MTEHPTDMIVAAAPAPPVPAPPGKPPLPLFPSSSLRRRSSNRWFSNGSAHGRDTTTITTRVRATRRWRWWFEPDGSQQDYGSSSLEEDDDYDYEDEGAFSGFGWAGELFDEYWFSKVFKTYGVILPVMLTSMFTATGLKSFLMAMAIPLSQLAISFLLKRKRNRDDIRYYERRRRRRQRHNFQSWVYKDFADAAASAAVGADVNTKSSSSGDGWGGNKSGGAYGGWDELLEAKRTRSRPPGRMRMRMRRRRMPRTMGLGSTRYMQAPPLNLRRWLVALFPFLRSWIRLL